jgi:plastocyanin/ABC-type transport system involved in multi-copper enzyme maturation permease subunit
LSWLLLGKELRELFVGRALWAMLLVEAPLVGFSFQQSVYLYSEASKSALRLPNLISGLSPLDGIVSPTFGAVYLLNTFLLPFVAIRLIAGETQHGGLTLLLQLPVSSGRLVLIKLVALAVGWTLALVPGLCALVFWLALGGHLNASEVAAVLLGHALYALVIVGVAFLAAAVTESSATAAIVALAVTLGSWALDFAGSTQAGPIRAIAGLSLTTSLRTLEHGLVGTPQTLTLGLLGAALLALTAIWLPTGSTRRRKMLGSAGVLGVAAAAIALAVLFPAYADVSENRRSSFNPADERALRQMDQGLRVSVYLSPTDTRRHDLDRNVLSKLGRSVPNLVVDEPSTGTSGLFGGTPGEQYGKVVYEYQGRRAESRSTTQREILPLLYNLAGLQVQPDPVAAYRGFTLVADARGLGWWFYALFPALCLAGWWLNQRPPARTGQMSTGRRPIPQWLSTPFVLVLLAGLGQTVLAVSLSRSGAARQTGVVVTLRDNAFDPGLFTLEGGEGQRIILTLVNRGSSPHNLSIPELGVQSSDVAPGQTGTIEFVSHSEGTHRFVCTLPGHEQAGMVGFVTIV